MRKARNIIGTAALLVVSTLLAVVVAEFVSRLFLDPVDYLKPRLVADDVLHHRIAPGSGGHDAWGFRNPSVPESADIVAIGDSQTYGIAATSGGAWPAALSRLSGRSVYNLSLGGYGPVHYLHLLRTRGLSLKPALVIVGLYYGNDMHEAHGLAYQNDYWASLRDSTYAAVRDSIDAARRSGTQHGETVSSPRPRIVSGLLAIREWLAHHSVLYRFAVEASPLGRFLRAHDSFRVSADVVTNVDVPESGVHTKLATPLRRRAVDVTDPGIREGVRVSIEALRRAKAAADSAGVDLLVAMIPTKERAYAALIEDDPQLPHAEVIAEVIANERRIDAQVKSALDSLGIDYVDVTPALQKAAPVDQIYPVNWNSHPTATGYRVIARSIDEYLKSGS